MEQSKQEKEIYELAELLMQSENLEASAIILRDFAEKCYQEGAVGAQNDCDHEWLNHSFDHFGFLQEQICDKCGAKQSVP